MTAPATLSSRQLRSQRPSFFDVLYIPAGGSRSLRLAQRQRSTHEHGRRHRPQIRSKSAGPFWLTIDIFCGTSEAYAQITQSLSTERVGAAFQTNAEDLKRFDIADLNVVKFSLPRPVIQADIVDRDMHGAGWAPLVAELSLN